MKTLTLTAEEIRMLGIQLWSNPCSGGCPLKHKPRLPKDSSGAFNCYARNDNFEYICPLQRAIESIETKLGYNECN